MLLPWMHPEEAGSDNNGNVETPESAIGYAVRLTY